jgi:hypothetical protein
MRKEGRAWPKSRRLVPRAPKVPRTSLGRRRLKKSRPGPSPNMHVGRSAMEGDYTLGLSLGVDHRTQWGLSIDVGAGVVSCCLPPEKNETSTAQPGRSSCPNRGSSRVRTTDSPPEVQQAAMSGGFAEAEPEARQVPLQSREARNEAMGLPSSQMADEGAERNKGCSAAEGRGAFSLCWMDVHPLRRGSMERRRWVWPLRRSADDVWLVGAHRKRSLG